MAKFQRKIRAERDDIGNVYISIRLRDGGEYARGNITKHCTAENAKVSEVFATIEAALFGEE